ncbi:MAG: hypothetical protein AB7Q30_13065 [Vicinamibacteria bacterium]
MNAREASVLAETRATSAQLDELVADLDQLRSRFNALGGTPAFEGAGLLFDAGGSGQEVPFNDFLGIFNALGTLEGTNGTPAAAWAGFLVALERLRG